MKTLRVALAVVITLAMLYIARTNSRGQPEYLTHSNGGFTFEMTTVPKVTEQQSDRITLTVRGRLDGRQVVFRTSQPENLAGEQMGEFAPIEMQPTGFGPGEHYVDVTAGDRGGRFYYFFEVADSVGATVATFTREDGSAFFLKYIGVVPPFVLISHILFIFAVVFCVAMAAVHSLRVITGGGGLKSMAMYLFWAMVFCFMGCYPFGIPMNHYAFGTFWEGVPFGTDATDNKTQLMFVYFVFAALATLGSLTNRRLGRNLFAVQTLGWIGLGSFAVMLFIYLIPHSIQFTPLFTYAFCYTWISLVAAWCLFGLLRIRSTAGQ